MDISVPEVSGFVVAVIKGPSKPVVTSSLRPLCIQMLILDIDLLCLHGEHEVLS